MPQTHAPQSQAQSDITTGQPLDEAINCGTRNRNPEGADFWALVAEDYRTHDSDPFAQGFWALFWHRFGNWRMSVRPGLVRKPLSLVYKTGARLSQWVCGIDLPYTVVVGRRVKLEHFGGMILVARAIGDDVIIRQNTTFGVRKATEPHQRPTIGDNVEIGAGAVIVGGITIGAHSTIGANSVVTRDLPAHATALGVPARNVTRKPSQTTPRTPAQPPAA